MKKKKKNKAKGEKIKGSYQGCLSGEDLRVPNEKSKPSL